MLGIGIAVIVLFLLLVFALPIAAIIGTVVSARRREWRFSISSVLGNIFVPLTRKPLLFLGTLLLIGALPAALLYSATGISLGTDTAALDGSNFTPIILVTLVNMVLGTLAMVTLTRAAVLILEEKEVRGTTVFVESVPMLLPGLILWWLQAIATGIGFLFFVIPGLILTLGWIVTLPVLVRERAGIFESFSRSWSLTSGARWPILLIGFIAIIIFSIVGGIIQAIGNVIGGYLGLIFNAAVSAMFGAAFSTGTAAIYHELRTGKEGLASGDLEAVFA